MRLTVFGSQIPAPEFKARDHAECSWYLFAAAIFELAGMRQRLEETISAAYGARARRPAYSVLDNPNLRSLGLDDLRGWREAFADHLDERRCTQVRT